MNAAKRCGGSSEKTSRAVAAWRLAAVAAGLIAISGLGYRGAVQEAAPSHGVHSVVVTADGSDPTDSGEGPNT